MLPVRQASAPQVARLGSALGRVECYYLGWLGNQEPNIQQKNAELAEAKADNDRVAVKRLTKELKDIARAAGTIELHDLHEIDYEEAVASHPDDWATTEDYKLITGPAAPKIVDKRDLPNFPKPQKSSGPPVIDAALTMNQVKRKIRTGVTGAP